MRTVGRGSQSAEACGTETSFGEVGVQSNKLTEKERNSRVRSVREDRQSESRRRQRGIVLIVVALAAFALVGILGLSLDLGRMQVAHGELQNYTDAAALSAAMKLDGTRAGIDRAEDAATGDVNRWAFGTAAVDDVDVRFSQVYNASFITNPLSGIDYRFVRVETTQPVPLLFMPLFPGVGWSRNVSARSVAGQQLQTTISDGVFPYSPDAHDATDPNFGFLLGRHYTLRWAKYVGNPNLPGFFKTSVNGARLVGCEADMAAAGFEPGEAANNERGYIDLTNLQPLDNGGGAALVRNAILTRTSFALPIEPFNYYIDPEPGQKQTETTAMQDRVWEDTDPLTPTYFTTGQTAPNTPPIEQMKSDYRSAYNTVTLPRPPNGNGRRLVITPINDPLQNGLVLGFVGFFLPPVPCAPVTLGNHTYEPCCGEYVGSVINSGGSGGGGAGSGPGSYRIVLFQ